MCFHSSGMNLVSILINRLHSAVITPVSFLYLKWPLMGKKISALPVAKYWTVSMSDDTWFVWKELSYFYLPSKLQLAQYKTRCFLEWKYHIAAQRLMLELYLVRASIDGSCQSQCLMWKHFWFSVESWRRTHLFYQRSPRSLLFVLSHNRFQNDCC